MTDEPVKAGVAGIAIEPRAGGHWYEVDRRGRRIDWGEVRAFEPDRRLVLGWAISADRGQEPPERASEVEVRFLALGPKLTRVEVEHRGFARHGAGAELLRGAWLRPTAGRTSCSNTLRRRDRLHGRC